VSKTTDDALSSAGYRLVPASLEAPEGLEAFLREIGEGENGFGGELTFISGQRTLPALLASMVDMAAGKDLPEGWVPATTAWLLDPQGNVVGMSRLRHALATPFLLAKGGNVGYLIKKSERGNGLGTFILRETLALARAIGLERVMVAANSNNTASLRVIESNGGVFEDEREAGPDHRFRRYWIQLS